MSENRIHLNEKRKVAVIAMGFFFLAALLGALMRFMWVEEISFIDYKHAMHAHSHTALFGWAFIGLASSFVFFLFPEIPRKNKFTLALKMFAIACAGMFLAFLYQGYGAISITLSTLSILIIYYFAFLFLKAARGLPNSHSARFAKWAVYWLLLSTAGLWAIAPVGAFLGKLHPLYFSSIQFFLHFQFNGWITYGILALLLKHFEKEGSPVVLPRYTFLILQISLILTYALSITWSSPESILFYLNSAGVLLQIIAFWLLFKGLYKLKSAGFDRKNIATWLLKLGLFSLVLKVLMQGAVAVPYIAEVSYTIRNFVIGFIHLAMLGSFSFVLISLWLHHGILPSAKTARMGFGILVAGFVLTEALLFLQGILIWGGAGFLPGYYPILFAATLLLPLALVLILTSTLNPSNNLKMIRL